jgi:DNA-binding response OmpR family regulator
MKALIIEDDNDIREILSYIITEQGWQVCYGDEHTSLSDIKRISPDLVILDDWMNKYGGTNFCDMIKMNDATRHIFIVLISTRPNVRELADACKCDGWLSEPFDLSELEDILHNMVPRSPTRMANPVSTPKSKSTAQQ